MKDKELAVSNQKLLNDHLIKKYILRVPDDELTLDCKWRLLRFPVLRPDKYTTNMQILLDALALFKGISLNKEALTCAKLHSDVFDMFFEFRKQLVAGWRNKSGVPLASITRGRPTVASFLAGCNGPPKRARGRFLGLLLSILREIHRAETCRALKEYPLAADAVKNFVT